MKQAQIRELMERRHKLAKDVDIMGGTLIAVKIPMKGTDRKRFRIYTFYKDEAEVGKPGVNPFHLMNVSNNIAKCLAMPFDEQRMAVVSGPFRNNAEDIQGGIHGLLVVYEHMDKAWQAKVRAYGESFKLALDWSL